MKIPRWVWIAAACVAAVLLAYSLTMIGMRRAMQRSITAALRDQLHGEVQIGSLQVSTLPYIRATAENVTVRLKGREDDPPFLTMQRLTLSANPMNLLRLHVSRVHVEGLQMRFPATKKSAGEPGGDKSERRKWFHFPFVIDHVESDNALLETLPRDAKHLAHDFSIQHVELSSFSFDKASPFRAQLTNPIPEGQIDSRGEIGPWDADDPANTAVSGTFLFSHADFSSIRGLSGIMSSTGKYDGSIDQIHVEGDTQMSDFALDFGGNPMPLKTHYIAVVDGSDGNTYLNSVEARLGESPLHVSGAIVGRPGVHGRDISLDTSSEGARAEDLLHLVLKGPAPMEGTIKFHAKFDLPPTPEGRPTVERLSLEGQVEAQDLRPTMPDFQNKLDELSRAAQGQPKNQSIDNVPANAACNIAVTNGVASFAGVKMSVMGASVLLSGSFDMESQQLDFHGHLDMEAKLSQATTGTKSFLLRLADPVFSKSGGGSSIPIKITGDMKKPSFGLDLHRKKDQTQANSL